MTGAEQSPRGSHTLARRIVGAVTERLAYKAAALFFALVLWLVVSGEEPSEAVVTVGFSPALDSALSSGGERPTIRALVVGRKRELLKLYGAQAHLHRGPTPEPGDSLRLELRPVDVELPAGIDASVRDVQPRAVTLHFAPGVVRQAAGGEAPRGAAAADSSRPALPDESSSSGAEPRDAVTDRAAGSRRRGDSGERAFRLRGGPPTGSVTLAGKASITTSTPAGARGRGSSRPAAASP